MIARGIGRRYATALFKIGIENDKVEEYGNELKTFRDFLETDKDLRIYLTTPLFKKTAQSQLLETILEKLNPSEAVRRFLILLFEKRRLLYLIDICDCYDSLIDEYKGICRAEVFSAFPLTGEILEKVKTRLKEITGKKETILKIKEDPQLIGGIVTKIGNTIYDGSVRTQLNIFKQNLKRGEG